MRFVCHSNLLYAIGLSEKLCEPSVTSDGYLAKKSLKEVHDVHVGSLGEGCVYISICSEDRKYARGLGKHMRKERGDVQNAVRPPLPLCCRSIYFLIAPPWERQLLDLMCAHNLLRRNFHAGAFCPGMAYQPL